MLSVLQTDKFQSAKEPRLSFTLSICQMPGEIAMLCGSNHPLIKLEHLSSINKSKGVVAHRLDAHEPIGSDCMLPSRGS